MTVYSGTFFLLYFFTAFMNKLLAKSEPPKKSAKETTFSGGDKANCSFPYSVFTLHMLWYNIP